MPDDNLRAMKPTWKKAFSITYYLYCVVHFIMLVASVSLVTERLIVIKICRQLGEWVAWSNQWQALFDLRH